MLRKLVVSLLLICGAVAYAQVSNPSIILVASAPSGPCTINLPDQQVIGAGAIYTCQNLTWGQVGGGSGGSFTALTGDATSTSTGGATTVKGINGTLLSGLATGPLYNTTTTGVPSIETTAQAIAALGSTPAINASAMTNFPTFNQNTTGTSGGLSGSPAITVSSCTGCGGGTPAYPIAITGGVSGGVVYGNDSTHLTVSPAGTANVLIKWGGAGAAPTNSSVTDNGTTATSTDTGGYVAPVFVANGTTAGFMDFPQGSTSAAVAPCNTATSICWQAPTSVTSQLRVFAGSPATGFPLYTNSGGTMTETIVPATGAGPNLQTALIAGAPTYTAGASVTSCAQASGYTNSNERGELTIVGGTATTGTICTVNFSTTLAAAPGLCQVTQNGGTTVFSIGHGTPSATAFTITSGISVVSSTVTVDYDCAP